jgi:hypothetical protein
VAHIGMRGNKGLKRNYIGKENVEFGFHYSRDDQLHQFREPQIRRQQSARAITVPDMNYNIWKICDNN